MTTRSRPRLVALVLFVVLALVAAACGDDSDESTSATTEPEGTAAPSADGDGGDAEPQYEEVTLKILTANANSGITAYMQKHGILEEELAKVNAKVEWVDGPGAFSANLDAMKAGDINVSQAAVSPVIGALIAGLDFKLFAISPPAENVKSSGVVATKSSGITKVEDLVGKRVAVNAAAHGEYILLKALQEAGISFDDVERVPIQPPEAAAAFQSGSIDAWATFNVFFQQAAANGTVVIYEDELESDDVGVFAASREIIEKNPKAFEVFVEVYNRLIEEAHAEPEKFQNIFQQSGPTAVSGAQLEQAIEDLKNTPQTQLVTPEGTARVQGVIDIFLEAGVLQKSVPAEDMVIDVAALLAK